MSSREVIALDFDLHKVAERSLDAEIILGIINGHIITDKNIYNSNF